MTNNNVSKIASKKNQSNFYIITQAEQDNEIIFIHSFTSNEHYLKMLDNKKINIISDCEVEMDLFKKIKTQILEFSYKTISQANSSETWLFRALASLFFGIFVFFVVLLIPDPVPFIDEISIGSLGGALFYYFSTRLSFFNFTLKKTRNKYLEKINYIKIIKSNPLNELNDFFLEIYDSLSQIIENDFVLKDRINTYLKTMDFSKRNQIKKFITIVAKNFSFKKILPNTKKFKKEVKKSLLSDRRFNFYYLLFEYFLN